jgi:hypothetical protein
MSWIFLEDEGKPRTSSIRKIDIRVEIRTQSPSNTKYERNTRPVWLCLLFWIALVETAYSAEKKVEG